MVIVFKPLVTFMRKSTRLLPISPVSSWPSTRISRKAPGSGDPLTTAVWSSGDCCAGVRWASKGSVAGVMKSRSNKAWRSGGGAKERATIGVGPGVRNGCGARLSSRTRKRAVAAHRLSTHPAAPRRTPGHEGLVERHLGRRRERVLRQHRQHSHATHHDSSRAVRRQHAMQPLHHLALQQFWHGHQ